MKAVKMRRARQPRVVQAPGDQGSTDLTRMT